MPPSAFNFNRTMLCSGPGTFYRGAEKIYSSSGINAELDPVTQKLPSDLVGDLDTIKTDQRARISVTNTGHITPGILTLLYPWRNPLASIGKGIFGTADIPAWIHSTAGKKVTFKNTALVQPPPLILSRTKTAFGTAEFWGLIDLLGDTAAGLHKIETAPYPPADLPLLTALGLTGALYVATWNNFTLGGTKNGWEISFEPEFEDVTCDELGTIDRIFAGMAVIAKCQPLGWDESKIFDNSPIATGLGMSIVKETPLNIASATGLDVTLYNAALITTPMQWGKTTIRAGELAFAAHINSEGKLYDVKLAS